MDRAGLSAAEGELWPTSNALSQSYPHNPPPPTFTTPSLSVPLSPSTHIPLSLSFSLRQAVHSNNSPYQLFVFSYSIFFSFFFSFLYWVPLIPPSLPSSFSILFCFVNNHRLRGGPELLNQLIVRFPKPSFPSRLVPSVSSWCLVGFFFWRFLSVLFTKIKLCSFDIHSTQSLSNGAIVTSRRLNVSILWKVSLKKKCKIKKINVNASCVNQKYVVICLSCSCRNLDYIETGCLSQQTVWWKRIS